MGADWSTGEFERFERLFAEGEGRWPASVAVVAALALYVALPANLTVGPTILLPVLEVALLVPLSIASPRRHRDEARHIRAASLILIALINAANVGSLILLIQRLLRGGATNGRQLLVAAVLIWLTNVIVFALWYWELDRGGPGARAHQHTRAPDFLFPQMDVTTVAPPGWRPVFVDYLYVSFTNATAFSPTDTMPLTSWSKLLMLGQSLASLLTVGLVAARAVNILK
jgi:uncharacterized membrane protein